MGINDIGKGPISTQGVSLQNASAPQLEAAAANIVAAAGAEGHDLNQSTIVGALEFLQANSINITQTMINSLEAGDPPLPTPTTTGNPATGGAGGSAGTAALLGALKGNPFLQGNAVAALSAVMLELAFELAKLKLTEGKIGAQTILDSNQMAKDSAAQTVQIGLDDFSASLSSGISQILAGGISIGGAAVAIRAGTTTDKDGNTSFDSQRASTFMKPFEGLSQITSGAGELGKGVFNLKKAGDEAVKTMMDQMLKLYDDKLSKANDAYRTSNDMLSQVLQAVQKAQDESSRAHSFGN